MKYDISGKEFMVDYFKIKYLINDCFYYEVLANGRTYEQAAGICYEAFFEYINMDGIEEIIAKSTIIMLKYRHKVRLNMSDIDSMKYIIEKADEMSERSFLNQESMEFFEEELEFIHEKLEELK